MTITRHASRVAAVVVLLVGLAAVAFVLLRPTGGTSTLRVQFTNAGGLIKGGEVREGGRKVGKIADLRLLGNGLVEAKLSIDKGEVTLRQGTRATIRAVGQATITNNFVALSPGSAGGPPLRDGAVLPRQQTTSIVNVDALLQSFGAKRRANLSELIGHGAEIYAGSGSKYFNGTLGQLSPALDEVGAMAGELSSDQAALSRFITTASATASALGSRPDDLQGAVVNSARAFSAIARQRRPLSDLIARSPAVLGQARGTLERTSTALTALRPALREIPAAAKPTGELLSRLTTTQRHVRPVVDQLRGQLPGLRRSFAAVPPIAKSWVTAFDALAQLTNVQHIVRALRIYGVDFAVGVPNGLAGLAVGNYNSYGHYARLEYVQDFQTSAQGALAPLLNQFPFSNVLDQGLFNVKLKQTRRCPGGNIPTAPDGSNPWVPDPSLCDPSQTPPASVNEP